MACGFTNQIKKVFLEAIYSVLKQDAPLSPIKISHDPDGAPHWFSQASLTFSIIIPINSKNLQSP